MKVYDSLDNLNIKEDTVVALGNFDGIHRGHRELILRSVKSAEAAGMKSAVFTFSNHPRNLLGKGVEVKNILYPEDKIHILQKLGVDYLFSIPFTKPVNMKTASPAPNPRYTTIIPRGLDRCKRFANFDNVNITIWNGTIIENRHST